MRGIAALVALLLAPALVDHPRSQPRGGQADGPAGVPSLSPTNHPLLSPDPGALWHIPASAYEGAREPRHAAFARAMALFDEKKYEDALVALADPAVREGPLGAYASFYAGRAQLALERADEALGTFRTLGSRPASGYLAEATALAEGETEEALERFEAAAAIYQRLTATVTLAPELVLMRLGAASKAAGRLDAAAEAFGSVYYGFPLGPAAAEAGKEYLALSTLPPMSAGNDRYRLELVRAERLYSAGRFGEARQAWAGLRSVAAKEDLPLIRLRLAQCDYRLRRFQAAASGLLPHTTSGDRRAEALYFHALTLRAAGNRAAYRKTIRQLVDELPDDLWAEDALDNLASHHILVDEDAEADAVFRELYGRFPKGRFAERAAWKIGWRAYRGRRYEDTARFFDQAAFDFPRSDYRPSWLYWSGRAHAALQNEVVARSRFELAADDYQNSYYGRLAVARLAGRTRPGRVLVERPADIHLPPGNLATVQALVEAGRYTDALNELRYAQRVWGDSSAIQASIAWILRQQGQQVTGRDQFTLLRGSINTMRRAYPQFMAAGGEGLPREILTTIFPLAYWDLIRKYARENSLDEYLVAALVAQESTFVPDIRSSANAVGLMQLIAPTARAYARRLKLPYSAALVRNPEANIRMGTAYLADKLKEFGALHLALASYNAGESAVRRWIAERPDLTDRDEFVDDIPYPETQNYVKRILGTSEDYRRLYGESGN